MKPLWQPDEERILDSQITKFRHQIEQTHNVGLPDYDALHRWSVEALPEFWSSIWRFCDVKSSHRPDAIVEHLDEFPGTRWFPGATLNFAENLLRFRDDQPAIVSLLENGQRRSITYRELWREVEVLASALRTQGLGPGDRVVGLMPNIPETIVAMLATTSIGAIWSSCSPDFGVAGATDRFRQIEPDLMICTTDYIYNGKVIDGTEKIAAIEAELHSLKATIVVPLINATPDLTGLRKPVLYEDFIAAEDVPPLTFEQLPFDHPLYIMYSSGTTGIPKCIVHGAGGTLLQHLKEHQLHTDIRRDDKLFYFTTCGWMMWNWLVSGLASGCTLVLYDGSPFANSGNILLDAIDNEEITIFGTSAKYIASLEKEGLHPAQSHSLASLRTILSTGSPLIESSYDFVYTHVKKDVCLSSISGGTDIISCFMLGHPALPVYRGEIQCRGLGMAVEFWNEDNQCIVGETGELVCTRPFPSTPLGFWNDPDSTRFHKAYFAAHPGVWTHGDYGELTEHGGIIIHGRSDAVLNPSGVRIGTAEIYRQVETLPTILDCLAVGQEWQGDERVVLFVVLQSGATLDDILQDKIRSVIRTNTTPRHVPAKIIQVTDIPRTISGKIVELAVRNVIHGKAVENTDALANPEALAQFLDLPELAY